MDSKMRNHIVLLSLLMLALTGCKENKWMDWKTQNELWLYQNSSNEGVRKTSDGLQYRIIADPTPQDARPNNNSQIVCDYTVKLINGYQVDGGNNVALNLSQCIPGFVKGCHLIHNNGDIELFIPCHMGYDYQKFNTGDIYNAEGFGTEGTVGYIPPYSTLIYKIHLCSVIGE